MATPYSVILNTYTILINYYYIIFLYSGLEIIMKFSTIKDIRAELTSLFRHKEFITDKTGQATVEIINCSFIADENSIFGIPNVQYIKNELDWYNSQSLNTMDLKDCPKIWKSCADTAGFINSNYGWCIYSEKNGFQYNNVLAELQKNKDSRRAEMIYTRPSMWREYNQDGRSDFMCTDSVQYVIRNNKLHAMVRMRSNDAIFGFRNDYAWQKHVLEKLALDLNMNVGNIYWNVGSLHVYAQHFAFLKAYSCTGDHWYTIDYVNSQFGIVEFDIGVNTYNVSVK